VSNTPQSSYLDLPDNLPIPQDDGAYEILSDSDFKFANSLKLPTFEANSMKLLKRLTMIIKDGVIINKHYPVFPSNKDVNWVLNSFSA